MYTSDAFGSCNTLVFAAIVFEILCLRGVREVFTA